MYPQPSLPLGAAFSNISVSTPSSCSSTALPMYPTNPHMIASLFQSRGLLSPFLRVYPYQFVVISQPRQLAGEEENCVQVFGSHNRLDQAYYRLVILLLVGP